MKEVNFKLVVTNDRGLFEVVDDEVTYTNGNTQIIVKTNEKLDSHVKSLESFIEALTDFKKKL